MNSKIIIAIVVLIVIAAAAYLMIPAPSVTPTGETGETPATDVTAEALEASSVISEEYEALILAELDKMSAEQTDFNNQIQEDLANDLSQFYYD